MKTPKFSAIALAVAVFGFADGALAQQVKKLFFEGDLVRHTIENQAGPFCVLTSQFKRKEAVAWRIRVLDLAGEVADDKVLKSVVVELGDGQKLPAHYGPHPPRGAPPTDYFWSVHWDDSGGLPDRIAGLQSHCHDDGRHDADLGAVQAGAVAAHGDRRRTGNEELTAGAVYEDLRRPAAPVGQVLLLSLSFVPQSTSAARHMPRRSARRS